MKKLMFAIGAVALCGAVFAEGEVASQIVGFQNKPLAITGFNYITPTFVQVDGTESILLQDIQMDETIIDEGANLQVLDKEGATDAYYNWYQKDEETGKAGPADLCDQVTVPEGKNGLWFLVEYDEESGELVYAEFPDAETAFDQGDGFQLWGRKNKTVTTAGGVSESTLAYALKITGFNYIGNPFPADVDLQDIQMDETIIDEGANLQVLDKEGATDAYYNWYQKDEETGKAGPADLCDQVTVPEGKNGLWFLVEYDEESGELVYAEFPEEVTFGSGDGFQLWGRKNKMVYITCPYEL